MSPLVAAPNRGYADWQRVENYDSGVLYSRTLTNQVGLTTSPVIDMSRYEYTGGFLQATVNAYTASWGWYADAAATVLLGSRSFVIHGFIPTPCQIRIPNLGPFLVLSTGQVNPSGYSGSINLIGTNRYNPLEMIPATPSIMAANPISVPAGLSASVAPSTYYSGPAVVNMTTLQGGMSWISQFLDTNNNLVEMDAIPIGGGTVTRTTVVPPGYWQITISNTNASAVSAILNVTPSLTGSM